MANLPPLSCVVTGTPGITHDKLFTFDADHPLAKWLGDVLDMRPAGPVPAAPPGGGPPPPRPRCIASYLLTSALLDGCLGCIVHDPDATIPSAAWGQITAFDFVLRAPAMSRILSSLYDAGLCIASVQNPDEMSAAFVKAAAAVTYPKPSSRGPQPSGWV